MAKRKPINEPLVIQVGARIRSLRLEQGLSLRKLATLAKCSTDGLVQIELGRSAITAQSLLRIARGLKVQPFDLLNLDTEHDDVGFILEKMRQEPETVGVVRESVGHGAAN